MRVDTKRFVTTSLVISLCSIATLTNSSPAGAAELQLERNRYVLPGDGTPNNNSRIGPYCCTGETVTVKTADGRTAGYAYFYNWHGQSFNVANGSIATDFEILVASVRDPSNTDRGSHNLEKGALVFGPPDLRRGVAKRTRVGDITYTARINKIKRTKHDGKLYFYMDSLKVTLYVSSPSQAPDPRLLRGPD